MAIEFDKSRMNDYWDAFKASQDAVRNSIIDLDSDHADMAAAKLLRDGIQAINDNLQFVGLENVAELMQKLEVIVDAVQSNKISFTPLLSDLVLVSLEEVYDLCEKIFAHQDVEERLDALISASKSLSDEVLDDAALVSVIKVYDPTYKVTSSLDCYVPDDTDYTYDDLKLFLNLAQIMEERVVGKPGKTQRICGMATAMNEMAGSPVDSVQLRAAALVHDLGMAFLPLSLLNKSGRYTDEERQKLFNHPYHGVKLLKSMENWEEASLIVEQHHERIDGQGYPMKLDGKQICDGAKILAIVDTFDSMSHSRADREHHRTLTRIVAEINAKAGQQFDEKWVNVFNDYVSDRFDVKFQK